MFVPPCELTLRDSVPKGDAWLHEVKFDGYRMQVHKAGWKVWLFTRNGVRFRSDERRQRRAAPPQARIAGSSKGLLQTATVPSPVGGAGRDAWALRKPHGDRISMRTASA
jgi:hypothetical protein